MRWERLCGFFIVMSVLTFDETASKIAMAASTSEDIDLTVSKIKHSVDSNERIYAEADLVKLIKNANKTQINKQNIENIISLLDINDDMVRGMAAVSLSYIGQRAKSAIPKLQAILGAVACTTGDLTSEVALRRALASMGVTTPRDACKE